MLQVVLNCPRIREADWHPDYGITSRRNAKLLAVNPVRNRSPHPDSFAHSGSETTLTLFMLGNLDGWKQVDSFCEASPRSRGDDGWNPDFFAGIREGNRHAFTTSPLWIKLEAPPFRDTGLDYSAAILLFEFEVMNRAFHAVNGLAFQQLSFLDVGGNRKWGAFDAFMIVPAKDPSEKRRGALIGFESKLDRDISRHTDRFRFVNQIMRNLEAGFWLTHHERSLYREWDFHYVFVCPQSDFVFNSSYYSWLLKDMEGALASYKKVLEYHRVTQPQRYENFGNWAKSHTHRLHWCDLATVLTGDDPDFFSNYIISLNQPGVPREIGPATVTRLRRAGIVVDANEGRGPVATTTEARAGRLAVAPEQRIVLRGVDWWTYQRLAEAAGDQPVRLAYNRGVLELMSPGPLHEDYKTLLSRLVEAVAEELGIPCKGLGSTRWDRAEAERGLEADACYFLAPAKLAAAAHRSADAADYPSPDLAIEVDLRRGEVDRPAIYATLGVAEVWRFDGESLRIDRLGADGTYEERAESLFLPIPPGEVVRWVLHVDSTDHSAWGRQLRAWVRAELVARGGRPGDPAAG
jgi:Uma2 family endonuclease